MVQDLRYAFRLMAKTPGFSLLIVFALALGIGANTTIFTAANDFLFRPLPFADAGRLVAVSEGGKTKELSGWTSPRDYLDWQQQNRVFEQMAAWAAVGVNLTGVGEPERVTGMQVTASFFPTVGVRPSLGRSFLASEDVRNGAAVAVLSHSLWQRRFGGRGDILGQTITANGRPYSVIGVMPPGFWFSNAHEDFYVSAGLDPAARYRGGHFLKVIARLKPGVSLEQARKGMDATLADIRQSDPTATQSVTVEQLRDHMAREVKPALLALLGAVGLVLLIACANVANMLLARATARTNEMAVRRAIGANSGRIVRQMLTESLLLAGAGAALGVVFALWGVDLLYRAIPTGIQPPRLAGVDWTVLAFAFALALTTGLLFGLAPALSASGADLAASLKQGGSTRDSGGARRMRRGLVIFEVAVSVVLLAGAGILIKSFARLSAVDPEFRPASVLTARVQRQRYQKQFCLQVLERASSLPGVLAAGAVSNLPLTGQDWSQNLTAADRPFRGEQDYIWACHRVASAEYFQAIGMRLLQGRWFGAADSPDRPRVAVINETFAKKAWPNENPIGKQFRIGDFPQRAGEPVTVAGVVADAKYLGLTDEAYPEMFFSMEQEGANNGMTFVLRTARDPHELISALRDVVREVDANQPITKVSTLETLVAESAAPQRVTALLSGIFGLLALVLAGTGLYGVVSYSVAQRTHEIGVRMALGAPYAKVVRLIVAEGLGLTLTGIVVGLAAALLLGRLLNGLLFQVRPNDPAILAAVAGAFAAIALAASYAPARRAAATDPLAALRQP